SQVKTGTTTSGRTRWAAVRPSSHLFTTRVASRLRVRRGRFPTTGRGASTDLSIARLGAGNRTLTMCRDRVAVLPSCPPVGEGRAALQDLNPGKWHRARDPWRPRWLNRLAIVSADLPTAKGTEE